MKAYLATAVTTIDMNSQVIPFWFPFMPITVPKVTSLQTFWRGVRAYQRYTGEICNAGLTYYSRIQKLSDLSYSIAIRFQLPNITSTEICSLLSPLYTTLKGYSIPVTLTIQPLTIPGYNPTTPVQTGIGFGPGSKYFASHLFLGANATSYNATFTATRATVVAGFTFCGVNFSAPAEEFGYPACLTSISKHMWLTVMHADIFVANFAGLGSGTARVSAFNAMHSRLEKVMDKLKSVTPTRGAYLNEADVLEPN
jgi:hypothetical protein